MASSKVMLHHSTSPSNPDPPRHQPPPKQHKHYLPIITNMDDILSNLYSNSSSAGDKTADDVWREVVTGRDPEMTLEDFLTKAGEEDVRIPVPITAAVPRGRGKRRAAVEEIVVDKATQQKQRRMIKNRESAARSRERKQAYTVELEALVTQLEEENARLVREEAEESKKRLKQLMENLIPVEDERKPPRIQTLQRSISTRW